MDVTYYSQILSSVIVEQFRDDLGTNLDTMLKLPAVTFKGGFRTTFWEDFFF